ncbi:hypothetical protein DUQ98_18435 [Salmonella enterica subsp. enterica]|nr:hypothetical protein [Salmonella enterica subsp. enterica serovar Typhimurium]
MLGGADNPNGELLSYIIGADRSSLTPTFSASETSSGRRMTGNDPEPPTVATAAESADCAGCP